MNDVEILVLLRQRVIDLAADPLAATEPTRSLLHLVGPLLDHVTLLEHRVFSLEADAAEADAAAGRRARAHERAEIEEKPW